MTEEQWDSFLEQLQIVNKIEDDEFINKIGTKILRKLESTEKKVVFKYLESQCTIIGHRVIQETLQNQNPITWLPSLHNMIARMFCIGLAIGSGEELDAMLD